MNVIALVDDLMFVSRIREAANASGAEMKTVRNVPALIAACDPVPDLVLMDLDSARLPAMEAIVALRAQPGLEDVNAVGFFSHVNPDRAREALAAGCTKVMPRSQFVKELPGLMGA